MLLLSRTVTVFLRELYFRNSRSLKFRLVVKRRTHGIFIRWRSNKTGRLASSNISSTLACSAQKVQFRKLHNFDDFQRCFTFFRRNFFSSFAGVRLESRVSFRNGDNRSNATLSLDLGLKKLSQEEYAKYGNDKRQENSYRNSNQRSPYLYAPNRKYRILK